MARDILCPEQAPLLVPGVQALGDVGKMKSSCVELLGTCILSIDSEGDVPNAKPGATKPVIESPLNYEDLAKVTDSCLESVMHTPNSVAILRCSRISSERYPKYVWLFY